MAATESKAQVAEEPYEHDVGDHADHSEEDLMKLMLPGGKPPWTLDRFSMSYSKAAFKGWVKQASPACAAASVAGAYNILAFPGDGRDHPQAKTCVDLLKVLRELLVAQLEKAQTSFERRAGGPIAGMLEELKQRLAADGKSLGGTSKKDKAVPFKTVLEHLNQMAFEPAAKEPATDDTASGADATAEAANDFKRTDAVWVKMREWFGEEREKKRESFVKFVTKKASADTAVGASDPSAPAAAAGAGAVEDADEEQDDENDEDGGEEESAPAAKPRRGSVLKKKWSWRTSLKTIIAKTGGIEKLERPRPSTGAFGNWGITGAVKRISSDPTSDVGLVARYLVSSQKATQPMIHLKRTDSEEDITEQWSTLRSEFNRRDTTMVYHLHNHYALIYGLREWVGELPPEDASYQPVKPKQEQAETPSTDTIDADAEEAKSVATESQPKLQQVRQVLTSRRGQRPHSWIDFSEIRDLLLRAKGYAIIAIKRTNMPPL